MKSRTMGKACFWTAVAIAVFASLSLQANAGDVTGPNWHHDRVEPNTTDVYEVTFEGGELVGVAILGDGDTDLDLFIYDKAGKLIESEEDTSDKCFVEWTPKKTAEYTIKVRNLGDVHNDYLLITN